jgi:broad specificity phosphatase PhoE
MEELKQRTDRFLEGTCLTLENMSKTILICSHGGTIVTLLARLLDASITEMLSHKCPNTAVTILEVSDERQISVCAFQCSSHSG